MVYGHSPKLGIAAKATAQNAVTTGRRRSDTWREMGISGWAEACCVDSCGSKSLESVGFAQSVVKRLGAFNFGTRKAHHADHGRAGPEYGSSGRQGVAEGGGAEAAAPNFQAVAAGAGRQGEDDRWAGAQRRSGRGHGAVLPVDKLDA